MSFSLHQVDALCDEFERAFAAGESPRIEAYLDRVEDADTRARLLRELIDVEMELIRGRGETVDRLAYRARFPEWQPAPVQSEHPPSGSAERTQVRSMNVRCPSCREPISISVDQELSGILCSACGSSFNLIDETKQTRQAPSFTSLGHFELVERLGVGAFGTVWKARDTQLDRTVALKIARQQHASAEDEEKFLREARAAAQLRHPNIVSIHEVGREADTLYIVSDLVRGVTLADWLTAKQPTFHQAAELCATVAEAVHQAHEAGVIHRDLKPQNIMLDGENQPHIMDFGLARREAPSEVSMTMEGNVLGTPAYMSPEQARGESRHADRRTDLYALGVILFQLVTGELPFRGNARMLLHQVLHDEPPSPRKFNGALPRDLETICLKCLQKEPDKRYPTGRALAQELRRFQAGEPIEARPVSPAERSLRWCRRNPMATAVMGLAALFAIAGPLVAVRQARLAASEAAAHAEAELARQAERRLSYNLAFDRGIDLCEDGRVAQGLLWLARALELVPPDDAAMERVIRLNLQGWRSQLHALELVIEHEQPVVCVAAGLDAAGQLRIATGGFTNTVQIWDAQGNRVGAPLRHFNEVHDIDFSPDMSTLLTSSFDGTAALWDWRKSEALQVVRQTGVVLGGAFEPNGERFYTVGADQSLRHWEVKTGEAAAEPLKQFHAVHDLTLNREGTLALTAGHDALVRLWDLRERKVLAEFEHSGTRVPSADFRHGTPNEIFTGDGEGNVIHWTWPLPSGDEVEEGPRRGKILREWKHLGRVHRLRVSSDGKWLATASFDRTARMWEIDTGRAVGPPFEHQASVQGVCFTPTSERVVTVSDDRTARLWHPMQPRRPLREQQHPGHWIQEAVFSNDGRYLLRRIDMQTVCVRRSLTGEQVGRVLPLPKRGIYGLVVGPDEGFFITAEAGGRVTLWDAASGEEKHVMQAGGYVSAVDLSVDGAQFVGSGSDGVVRVWDVVTGESVWTSPLPVSVPVYRVHYSPDGAHLMAFSPTGIEAFRLDARAGQFLGSMAPHEGPVWGSAFSRDGAFMATLAHDGTARVWEMDSGEPVALPMPHAGPLWSGVGFNETGTLLVTGCDDGRAQIWDVATGKPVGPAIDHGVALPMAAFASEGVITGTNEGTVRLWEVDVSQVTGSVREVVRETERLTGMILTEDGTVHALGAREWRERQR